MMKKSFVGILYATVVGAAWLLAATVEMGTPILKTSPEEIVLTTSFDAFDTATEYRIGIGAVPDKADFQGVEITLRSGDAAFPSKLTRFTQGFVGSWFNVDEILAQGYILSGEKAARTGERLTLKVTIPRAEADRVGTFYIFIAKNYGSDTWYLEDGSEANKSLW